VPVFGLAIGFMRFSGPECMMILGNTTVNRWFVRRRGRATVLRSLSEAGLLAFPAMVNSTIVQFGWRATVQWLAFVVLALGLAACTVIRRDPESLGLQPDGESSAGDPSLTTKLPSIIEEAAHSDGQIAMHNPDRLSAKVEPLFLDGNEPEWEFGEVMREPFFWALCVSSGLFNLFWAGLNLHSVDLFAQNGVQRDHVAALTVRFISPIFTSLFRNRLSPAHNWRYWGRGGGGGAPTAGGGGVTVIF
jgi:hypothetical protein